MNPRYRFAGLLTLLVVCFFLRLGAPGLWEKDEGRYAQAAREMRRSGDLVVPTLRGENRLNKPPLVYWLIAVSQETLGENEFACRLPSAIAGVLTAVLLFLLGRRMAGETAGWFAAFTFATTVHVSGMARLAHPESILCLAVTASVICFYLAYLDGFRKRRLLVMAWLAAGAGFLVKGPHGILLPVLVMVVFLAVRRELRMLGRLMFLRGLLLALLPVVAWGAAVVLQEGWGIVDEWVRETVGRVSGSQDFHPEPPWFFVPKILSGFLPWTLWAPVLFVAFRRREGGSFLLVWAAAIFVFFSASTNKASSYMLSVIPPLSVAIGVALTGIRPGRVLRATGVALIVCAIGVAVFLIIGKPDEVVFYRVPLLVTGGLFSLALLVPGVLILRGRERSAALAAVAGAVVTMIAGMAVLAPAASPLHSVKDAGLAMRKAHRPGDVAVNSGSKRAGLLWYTDLPIERRYKEKDVPAIWTGPVRYVMFGKKRWRDALEADGLPVYRIWSHPDRTYCVYSNKP